MELLSEPIISHRGAVLVLFAAIGLFWVSIALNSVTSVSSVNSVTSVPFLIELQLYFRFDCV